MPRDVHRIASHVAELVSAKGTTYGNCVGRVVTILHLLYPRGIPARAYDNVLLLAHALDKLCRLVHAAGERDPAGESPWLDVAGYALLALQQHERRAEQLEGGER